VKTAEEEQLEQEEKRRAELAKPVSTTPVPGTPWLVFKSILYTCKPSISIGLKFAQYISQQLVMDHWINTTGVNYHISA